MYNCTETFLVCLEANMTQLVGRHLRLLKYFNIPLCSYTLIDALQNLYISRTSSLMKVH